MLIKQNVLERIERVDVNLAFRRWRRPTVKVGTQLRTAVGIISIEECAPCTIDEITEEEARRAGYDSLAQLTAELTRRPGSIYCIRLRYAGPDPRLALRERIPVDPTHLREIVAALKRLDRASGTGPWTGWLLQLIQENPLTPAAGLADLSGQEKERLKTNVRKLKNLGLTISHHPGYELSPRGRAVLRHLNDECRE